MPHKILAAQFEQIFSGRLKRTVNPGRPAHRLEKVKSCTAATAIV
jgi:hypothetical protein